MRPTRTNGSDGVRSRRSLLAGVGTLVAGLGTAGCLDNDDSDGRDDIVMPGEAGPRSDGADGPTVEHDDRIPEEVHEFLERTNEYDGSLTDRTGEASVEIAVGAGEGGLAFLPTVVQVDWGTEIVWEWTGAGGDHNVVHDADDPLFHSGETVDDLETRYQYTFDEPGTYKYVCEPHWAAGMRGVIEVI